MDTLRDRPARPRACNTATVVALVSLMACSVDRQARRPLDTLLAGVACVAETLTLMDAWDASQAFIEAPPSVSGARTYRFPTDRVGTWIVLSVDLLTPPTVTRVTPVGATSHAFTQDCSYRVAESVHESPPAGPGEVFTDLHLRDVLASDPARPLVVYSWSPHMPLSVDGFREVAEAARARGLSMLPVLIAHSDLDFATREADRVGIPTEGLRQIDSVELIQRGLQLHAPSVVVFGSDRISPLLPGYRTAEGYGRFFDAYLDGGG